VTIRRVKCFTMECRAKWSYFHVTWKFNATPGRKTASRELPLKIVKTKLILPLKQCKHGKRVLTLFINVFPITGRNFVWVSDNHKMLLYNNLNGRGCALFTPDVITAVLWGSFLDRYTGDIIWGELTLRNTQGDPWAPSHQTIWRG